MFMAVISLLWMANNVVAVLVESRPATLFFWLEWTSHSHESNLRDQFKSSLLSVLIMVPLKRVFERVAGGFESEDFGILFSRDVASFINEDQPIAAQLNQFFWSRPF